MKYSAVGSAMSSGRGTHFTTASWESGDCSEVQNDTFAEPAQDPALPIRGRYREVEGLGTNVYTILDSQKN